MTDPSAQDLLDDAFGSPGDHPTIAGSVANQLRELILTGKLPPGTPLRLSKVATRMGVSVMPVREAIRILEAERLVTVEPRRGASVAHLSIDDIEELYAVRSALEGLAARHGTTQISAKGLKAMRTELAAMAKASDAGDRGGFLAHDRKFHDALYQASGRPRLVARIDELLESGRRIVDPYVYRPWYPLKVTTEAHRPILEAVEARDAVLAEALIRDNIAKAGERAIVAFEEDRDREMGGEKGTWPDEVPGLA